MCFEEFTKVERLDQDRQWFCDKCQYAPYRKKITLWTLPKVLFIQLKRFNYDVQSNEKIEAHVEYPLEGLDLNEYVSNNNNDKSIRYSLIAVVNHRGNLAGGHYTAFAKMPSASTEDDQNTDWYRYDDNYVKKITKFEVEYNKHAYVLIYQQQKS